MDVNNKRRQGNGAVRTTVRRHRSIEICRNRGIKVNKMLILKFILRIWKHIGKAFSAPLY